ncbi:MAG TPA: rhomboid family intramembrane serine protease [Deltaproteobacteria bacterium]|nr:rhomboid family intramembrane serine protease [Deltaproteobacteria bacterium]HPR54358.1 rhomboid family intramembrane serine protease [Deltaproteobacteria bacterium]HXK47003.1 rhomboid family intramembrane serine protease [Deltaproteobacteria bacterium]
MIPVRDTTVARGFAPVTTFLIIANLAMFIQELRLGEQIFHMFRASPADIVGFLIHGTPGFCRIHISVIASGFMHIGYVHLIGNLIFLSVFGPSVEKSIGMVRFAVFYLAAILAAFYVHAMIHPHSSVPVVGASGAIAGVMGTYLVLNPKGRILTIIPLIVMLEIIEVPSLVFILIWFALQGIHGFLSMHSSSPVAWFSHIGGFLMGLVTGIHYRLLR